MKIGSLSRIMASIVWMLWLGVVLGSCSAGPRCPTPCLCPPATLTCQGCPKDYIILSNDTQLLSVNGCKNIEYLLKLHSSHIENEQTKYSLHKLEITDSFMDKIPDSYISNEYPIQSLNFSNNLIQLIEPGLDAQNLTHLDLSHNRLSCIGNRTFYRMNNMLYLDISYNLISNLSIDSFIGLEKLAHLDISKNNLTFLMDALFVPMTSLQQLNLSYNMLEILSDKCFGSLLLLQQLDISYNRLTNVAPGTLQFLPNLAKLLLADNPHLKPDAQIFVGTGRRLQQVDASRTGLKRVPEALTHSVRYLSLAGNRISTIRCGDLDGYPLLHMLDFSDNIIVYVEDDALGRLEMISKLYLDKNQLQAVPKMLPDKLSHLSVDSNLIKNLTIVDFTGLTNLKELVLSNNLIAYIQENAFEQLASLEVLDISNNPLKILSPNTFGGPLYLKVLKICNVSISPPAKDISFPVPFPERIEQLHLKYSPGLMREFLADTAALAAMTRLQYLDMSYTNTSNIRSDLLHFLPEIKHLELEGNNINCSELNWLAEWMRENEDVYANLSCSLPEKLAGKRVISLPSPIRQSLPTFDFQQKNKETEHFNDMIAINNNKKLLEMFSSLKINVSNVGELRKIMNRTNNAKSLLDIQYDQYHTNLKFPKKVISKFEQVEETHKQEIHESLKQSIKSINSMSPVKNESDWQKINNYFPTNATSANTINNKKKLIEIFSQLSQTEEHNSLNVTNTMKKINSTTDLSVPLCNTNGNLNGTENKTKCFLLPEKPSQIHENKNLKPQKNIYRKSVEVKQGDNSKLKNWKYVSVPKEYIATMSKLKSLRRANLENSTRKMTLLESKSNESIEIGTKTRENVRTSQITDDGKIKTRDISKKNNTKEESLNWKDFVHEKQYGQMKMWNISQPNNKVKQINSSSKEDLYMESVENVSDHQTLEFKAEESIDVSYIGIGFLAAVLIGGSAVLTIIAVSRKRSRRTRLRNTEMMEVQTISAVGELW